MKITTFGVELEGAWWGDRFSENKDLRENFVGDGSLSFSRSSMFRGPKPAREDTPIAFGIEGYQDMGDWADKSIVIGEYPSPVFDVRAISDGKFKKWLGSNYPDFVNRSCGYHIHLGMPIGTYSALADLAEGGDLALPLEALQLEWIKAAKKFISSTAIFEAETQEAANVRFGGAVSFCSSRQDVSEVLLRKSGSRYAHLNFQAFYKHKTLEIRSFPGFGSWREAFAATSFTLGFFRNLPEEPKKAAYKRLKPQKAKKKEVRFRVSLSGVEVIP